MTKAVSFEQNLCQLFPENGANSGFDSWLRRAEGCTRRLGSCEFLPFLGPCIRHPPPAFRALRNNPAYNLLDRRYRFDMYPDQELLQSEPLDLQCQAIARNAQKLGSLGAVALGAGEGNGDEAAFQRLHLALQIQIRSRLGGPGVHP